MAGGLKSRLARLKELGLVKASDLGRPGGEPGGEGPEAALPEGGRAGPAEAPPQEAGPQEAGPQEAGPQKTAPQKAAPQKAAPREAGGRRRAASRPDFLEGWTELAPLVYRRELSYPDPLPALVDCRPFRSLSGARGAGPDSTEELCPSGELRIFDLETTGLSGGAGTIAFLAAVGRVAGGELLVAQLFLADYPGEAAFVEALLAELGDRPRLASYNGRAFDLPLLSTRCVMCGRRPPEPALHLDALYLARRLWRRVHGGASLGLLERAVLGLEREGDVPGALVPEVYFEYLRSGSHPLMPGVLSHNAEDVASLARLLGRELGILAEPRRRAALERLDLLGLGSLLLALGREEEGEEILEAAAAEGQSSAGLLLARRRRRSGRLAEAREALSLVPDSYEGFRELSRLEERLARDLPAALAAAREALARAGSGAEAEEAERRRARLERRLARRKGEGRS